MHPFKKLCKHAQIEIDRKFHYNETEKDKAGGCCWKCNKSLTEEKRNHYTSMEEIKKYVGVDESVDEAIKENPALLQEVLDHANQRLFVCVPCFTEMLDESFPLKNVFSDFINPNGKWKQWLRNNIKEVEECGKDCPWWNRLDNWKEQVNGEN